MSNIKKVVHSQGREIIYNVYTYMKTKREQGLQLPSNNLNDRVAEAWGVSVQ